MFMSKRKDGDFSPSFWLTTACSATTGGTDIAATCFLRLVTAVVAERRCVVCFYRLRRFCLHSGRSWFGSLSGRWSDCYRLGLDWLIFQQASLLFWHIIN